MFLRKFLFHQYQLSIIKNGDGTDGECKLQRMQGSLDFKSTESAQTFGIIREIKRKFKCVKSAKDFENN